MSPVRLSAPGWDAAFPYAQAGLFSLFSTSIYWRVSYLLCSSLKAYMANMVDDSNKPT